MIVRMFFALIGPKIGPVRMVVSRDPEAVLARMRESRADEIDIIFRQYLQIGGRAEWAERLTAQAAGKKHHDGWLAMSAGAALGLAQKACDLVMDLRAAVPGSPPNYAELFRWLRTEKFGMSQAMLGEIAGMAESSVSRIEKGTMEPSASHLWRIRQFAAAHGVEIPDAAFFEPPPRVDIAAA